MTAALNDAPTTPSNISLPVFPKEIFSAILNPAFITAEHTVQATMQKL